MTNTKKTTSADPFADMNEVKSSFVQWGQPGDWIRGTLVSVREVESRLPGKEGELQKIYEIQADSGSFHAIDENKKVVAEPTIIQNGHFWNIGGKAGIDNAFRNIKVGQIVGLRFAEETPSKTKGFNPSKIIKVLAGGMNPDFHGQGSDMKEVGADELPE